MSLIDIYYEVSELFDDDIELLISAFIDLTTTTYKRVEIRGKLESLNLKTIDNELNQLYDMTIDNLKAYKLQKTHHHKQTTIFDFLKDDYEEKRT